MPLCLVLPAMFSFARLAIQDFLPMPEFAPLARAKQLVWSTIWELPALMLLLTIMLAPLAPMEIMLMPEFVQSVPLNQIAPPTMLPSRVSLSVKPSVQLAILAILPLLVNVPLPVLRDLKPIVRLIIWPHRALTRVVPEWLLSKLVRPVTPNITPMQWKSAKLALFKRIVLHHQTPRLATIRLPLPPSIARTVLPIKVPTHRVFAALVPLKLIA